MIICPLCNSQDTNLIENVVIFGSPLKIFRCSLCGLSFSDKMEEAKGEHYEIAEWYGERWEFEEVVKLINMRGQNLLEIGCGKGFFLNVAEKAGARISGIDINKSAIDYAKKKFNLKNVYADTLDDFLKKNRGLKFEIICLFHILEHLANPSDFVKKISELLDLNGFLCLSFPNPKRVSLSLLQREYWDYPPHHLTRWDEKSIKYLLENKNFEIIKIVEEPLSILKCTESIGTFFQTLSIKKSSEKGQEKESYKKIFFSLRKILKPLLMIAFLPLGFCLYIIGKIKKLNGQAMLVIAKKSS